MACKDGNVPIVVALCEANCNLDLSNKVKLEGRSLHSPSMSLCLPASGFGQVSLFTVQSQYCFYGPVLFHRALLDVVENRGIPRRGESPRRSWLIQHVIPSQREHWRGNLVDNGVNYSTLVMRFLVTSRTTAARTMMPPNR